MRLAKEGMEDLRMWEELLEVDTPGILINDTYATSLVRSSLPLWPWRALPERDPERESAETPTRVQWWRKGTVNNALESPGKVISSYVTKRRSSVQRSH